MSQHPLSGIIGSEHLKYVEPLVSVADRHGFYLAGGTGLALHLHHRASTDLDFFIEDYFEPNVIIDDFGDRDDLLLTQVSPNTVNAYLGTLKVQFLGVPSHHQVEPTQRIGGIRVAGIGDILAMKLLAITGRGKMRDYFDLMILDSQTPYTVEAGLEMVVARTKPTIPEDVVGNIILALGYFGDVGDDDTLPASRKAIEKYWTTRQVSLVGNVQSTRIRRRTQRLQ